MLAVESKFSAVGSSPGLRLPVAPRLAGDTAKVLAALMGHEPLNRKPPKTSVKSEDCPENGA